MSLIIKIILLLMGEYQCEKCGETYDLTEIQYYIDVEIHEKKLCLNCILNNLPAEVTIDINDIECENCGILFDSDQITRIGINYTNNKCYECLIKGMENVNCDANTKLCNNKQCLKCFNKSLASSNRIKNYHIKNKIFPRSIFLNSHRKMIFNCDTCYHCFGTNLNRLSKGSWCPYCSHHKLCKNKCEDCFNKTIASLNKAKFWSDKNKEDPSDIFLNNRKKYWFDCEKCDHEFEISAMSVSKDRWCSYCSNKKLCECERCFKKSFSSSHRISSWSDENKDDPRYIFLNSNKKCWFNCKECDSKFEMRLQHVTNGSWCPYCKNKTEQKVYLYLITLETITRQFKADWCKNKKYLPFDFLIEKYKLIIEIDGDQHFFDKEWWKSIASEKIDIDLYKIKCALKEGYTILRIYQPDIFKDNIDWKQKIIHTMEKIKEDPTPKCIFFAKNMNIYDKHSSNL